MDPQTYAGMTVALVLFGVVVAILWILLPFAVFGIKDKLQEIINQLRLLNEKFEHAAPQKVTGDSEPPITPRTPKVIVSPPEPVLDRLYKKD